MAGSAGPAGPAGPAVPHPRDLGLAEARALVQRAVDKAEQLGLRGAVAVVGASGTLLTASRMDAGGPGGMARARSKAWISATQQIPSSEHLHRMTTIAPPVAAGFVQASPEALFPGAGGMPVSAGGVVVAGIAASGATVSPFFPDGVDPRVVSADGRPANPEDLLLLDDLLGIGDPDAAPPAITWGEGQHEPGCVEELDGQPPPHPQLGRIEDHVRAEPAAGRPVPRRVRAVLAQ